MVTILVCVAVGILALSIAGSLVGAAIGFWRFRDAERHIRERQKDVERRVAETEEHIRLGARPAGRRFSLHDQEEPDTTGMGS